MKFQNDRCNITPLGEFSDKDLEQKFFHYYMNKNIKYLRPSVLAFGIFNLLFIIPDYFYIETKGGLIGVLANRLIFLLAFIALYYFFNKIKNIGNLARLLTAFEIFSGISFLIVYMHYNNPNFLIQSLGVILIILIIFIVPNKWKYTLISSTSVSLLFIVFSLFHISETNIAEYLAGLVYILVVLIMNIVNSYSTNYFHRKQYIYSRKLLSLSSTDQLTGIYNRSKLDLELKHWLTYSKKCSKPLSLVFFDIDNFKGINDAFGHLTGDEVIVEIANIVKALIKEDDIFVRWGGDEFMLLLPNVDKQQALDLTEKIRTSVTEHYFKKVGKLTCSFGLVSASEDDDVDDLLCRADKFLYMSKQKGKNVVTVEDNLKV